jgi:hypothetical protein
MGPLHQYTQVVPSARHAARRPEVVTRGAGHAVGVLVVALAVVVTAIDAGAQSAPQLDSTSPAVGAYTPTDRHTAGHADTAGDVRSGAAPGAGATPGAAPGAANPRITMAASLPAALADSSSHLYELVLSESDSIRSAIDLSVAHMNFIVRPIARRRLTKANRLARHIAFAVAPDTLTVTFDGMNPILTPRDGGTSSWVRGDTRERYDVHIESAGDTLRQVIATDDGQRENDFEFLDNGARIALHVILTAERLPMPLRYTLIYRRSY